MTDLFLSYLKLDLEELENRVIAESNFTDYNGNPTACLILENIEHEDNSLYLNCEYHRQTFQKTITFKSGAKSGWTVKNKKDKFLLINIQLTFTENSVNIHSVYEGKEIETNGQMDENIIEWNTVHSEIESKTVSDLLAKTFSLLQIHISNVYEEYEGDD